MFSVPALDDLPDDELHVLVHQWIADKGAVLGDVGDLEQAFNTVLPRTIFFKSLPPNASVLDVGAGDGSMAIYKEWPAPARPDIHLHALSLQMGMHFNRYESYELKNFETEDDVFQGVQFDAIICAHFIEHMREPSQALAFCASKLSSGGRLYLEWPHALTKRLPNRSTIMERGVEISTFNFFDDDTHVETWPAQQLIGLLEDNGFAIETGGRVYMPWLAQQMRNHAHRDADMVRMTLGAWAAFGWAQYVIASKL